MPIRSWSKIGKFVLKVIEHEEARFAETLDLGLAILDQMIFKGARQKNTGRLRIGHVQIIPTPMVFPAELTQEVAAERGLSVDMEGFKREMEGQRKRARAAHTFKTDKTAAEVYGSLSLGSHPVHWLRDHKRGIGGSGPVS